MRVNDLRSFGEEGNLAQHLVAAIAVFAHDGAFFFGQRAWFAKDGIGYGHLANVVQEGAACDDANAVAGESHGAGDGNGKCRHPLGVAFGLGIF